MLELESVEEEKVSEKIMEKLTMDWTQYRTALTEYNSEIRKVKRRT